MYKQNVNCCSYSPSFQPKMLGSKFVTALRTVKRILALPSSTLEGNNTAQSLCKTAVQKYQWVIAWGIESGRMPLIQNFSLPPPPFKKKEMINSLLFWRLLIIFSLFPSRVNNSDQISPPPPKYCFCGRVLKAQERAQLQYSIVKELWKWMKYLYFKNCKELLPACSPNALSSIGQKKQAGSSSFLGD